MTACSICSAKITQLEIAVDGPCKGHLCDNCKICQRGRCCRNDNPNYKLPELGEWNGPIFGELGLLKRIGDKVECHCCGEVFYSLNSHVWQKHNLTAAEYKAIFGLSQCRGLVGTGTHEKLSVEAWKRYATTDFAERGLEAVAAFTPEQRYAHNENRHMSLESRRKISEIRGGKKALTCVICGTVVYRYWANKSHTCGEKCLSVYKKKLFEERGQKLGGKESGHHSALVNRCPQCGRLQALCFAKHEDGSRNKSLKICKHCGYEVLQK